MEACSALQQQIKNEQAMYSVKWARDVWMPSTLGNMLVRWPHHIRPVGPSGSTNQKKASETGKESFIGHRMQGGCKMLLADEPS